MNPPAILAFFGGAFGPGEAGLVLLAVLVLFGPRKLPGIARQIGKITRDLRRASQDFHDEIMRIEEEPPPAAAPAPGRDQAVPSNAPSPPGAAQPPTETPVRTAEGTGEMHGRDLAG